MKRFERLKKHIPNIILLAIGIIVGSLAVGYILPRNPVTMAFDAFFYDLIANMPRNKLLDTIIIPFNFNFLPWGIGSWPSYFYFMVGFPLLYVLIFKRSLFPWLLLTIIISALFVMQLYAINSQYVFRERPFTQLPNQVDEDVQRMLKGWNSFPSGHTRETAMWGTVIASFIPALRIPMILFTLFIAFSRVYLGFHYPTDVIAGMIIGFLVARLTLIIVRELQIVIDPRKGEENRGQPKQSGTDTVKDQTHL